MRYSHGELVQLAEEGRRKKMPRLIDADALYQKIDAFREENAKKYPYSIYVAALGDVLDMIEDAPTADIAERKKGRWIDRGRISQCSECARFCMIETSFCPNCGADMRGGGGNVE